jgi:predicted ATPase
MILISDIHQKVFNFLMGLHDNNKEFLFVLRQLNRNARLEKGYWFLGNDTYVSIPFWIGSDYLTKSPRVSFSIKIDGSTYLEVINETRHNFFSTEFFEILGFSSKLNYLVNKKSYSEFGNDYIASLRSFIETDKLLIDDYISRQIIQDENRVGSGGIDFVWPGSFKKQLSIVHRYQKIRNDRERKSGYLRSFRIRKFGKIENLTIKDIPQDCRWIFLTGENGSGKTSILRALAVAILNNNDHGNPVAENYGDFSVQIGLDTINGIKKQTIKSSADFRKKSMLTKGFASYGPVRLLSQSSLKGDFKTLDSNEISRLNTFGLFNPIGILRDLSGGIDLYVKPKYHEMTFNDFLDNIERNLELILPNIQKVSIGRFGDENPILYQQSSFGSLNAQEAVQFDQLPSGTRNFAALILDLLLRFAEQQKDVADISDYVGIVLIDEIDLHLHPKMQKEIIVQLAETFPNIQFIVTTHSPIPMLGASENSVFINVHKNSIHEIAADKLDIDISNLLPNTILTSPIFNFNELINEYHDRDERLVTEDDYEEAIFYKILEKKIKERSIIKPEE